MKTKNKLEAFYVNAISLADKIEKKQESIISLLQQYETFDAANDEIMRSIEALKGFEDEFMSLSEPLEGLTISTFFPLNLPLYSLVLFGIAPSAFSDNIYIRPPEIMNEVLDAIFELLEIRQLFPEISLQPTPRKIFIDLYAKDSDAIIFTGKYENALDIYSKCPDAVLLYNGSGVNPLLVLENADIKLAAEKTAEMRCFNSGQDCAGPDAIFVPKAHKDSFVSHLRTELEKVQVGDTRDKNTSVGPTMKIRYLNELMQWIDDEKPEILYGGKIDENNKYVYPTVVESSIEKHGNKKFHEFFAPFFYVLTYNDEKELQSLFDKENFNRRAMYVSIFGESESIEIRLQKYVTVLKNKIVNDVERGNEEYGGFGPESNFILNQHGKVVQPILVSRDLHKGLAEI